MIKFRANQKDFQNALGIASRAVATLTTMPILNCVLLEIGDGRATIVGNDMEKSIESEVTVDVDEQGVVAVNAKMLLEIIRKLPDSDFTFDCDDNYTITIKSGKAKFAISGQDPIDFPELANVKSASSIAISQGLLRKMIQGTIFSVAQGDSNNKLMTGELFDVHDGSIAITALDGHRVSIRCGDINDSAVNQKVVVPSETLREIMRILPDDWEAGVNIYFSKSHIVFELDGVRAVSRLIDGEFFDIGRVIRDDITTKVTVNRVELCKSLERSLLLVKENSKTPIVFDISDDVMNLSINSSVGKFNESTECMHEGSDMVVAFNPKLLLDAFNAIDDDEVVMHMSGEKSPCYIKDEDGTYNYVVLPVNFVR